MPNLFTPAQIRGARGMLDWSMLDLAKAAGVSVSTVKRVEQGCKEAVSNATYSSIRDALEAAGVRFLDDMDAGVGVSLTSR